MNSETLPLKNHPSAPHRVEFFRLPAPGERDPCFGRSRGGHDKAAAVGEIKMVAVRSRTGKAIEEAAFAAVSSAGAGTVRRRALVDLYP